MRGNRMVRTAVVVALLCFAGASLSAEIYVKQIRKTDPFTIMGQTQPEQIETIVSWYGKNSVRVDTGEETSIIVLGDKQIMYMINHAEKAYMEMPVGGNFFDTWIDDDDEDDEDAEEAREFARGMAESMMGSMAVKVTPTGETKKIRDWNCRKYIVEMSMGGMMNTRAEAWATEDIKIDPGLYHLAANAMTAGMGGFEQILQEMQKIKGMIVHQETTSETMGAKMRMVEEVVEAVAKAAPAGAWDIPKGYKKGSDY